MLSILIPIYNYDVRSFVRSLSDQALALNVEVEILCLDDASDTTWRELNKTIGDLPGVTYEESAANLGRSKVRNALVDRARFDHLLFLDCDGKLRSGRYLHNYLEHLHDYDVLYGGRVYSVNPPADAGLRFHWLYGSQREAAPVDVRLNMPYKSFMTNNFLVRREVFASVKMDEALVGYGHEDTLFAQEMKRKGFRIHHIENPVEHTGLETASVFLSKSDNGIQNLALLIRRGAVDESIRLVRYYFILKRLYCCELFRNVGNSLEKRIRQNLEGPRPRLFWFDFWKLSRLCEAMR